MESMAEHADLLFYLVAALVVLVAALIQQIFGGLKASISKLTSTLEGLGNNFSGLDLRLARLEGEHKVNHGRPGGCSKLNNGG